MAGIFKHKNHSTQAEDPEPLETKDTRDPEQTKITDELLDAIDDVLETNAEEFVKGYVQKGGQ